MIAVHDLTRRYGDVTAVDHLTFAVQPGSVTAFLGPNGAGKSTTMRMILGLEQPDAGTATVDGRPYRELTRPLRHMGALLDANAVDGTRSAADHLRWLANSNSIPTTRIVEVLDLVDLGKAADRKVANLSLGMRQRLGIAAALLGEPGTLLLDEPINGLDPDGIVWALDKNSGSALWSQPAMARRSLTSPAVQGDYAVVGDYDGYLHWLRLDTGELAARTRASRDALRAPPVVVDGILVVEDTDGGLGAYRIE